MGPLFVELVGFPGAGKTTVANEVVKILASRGYRAARHPRLVTGPASRLRHSLRFLWFRLANWRLGLTGLRYALSMRPLRLSRCSYVGQMLFRAYHQREMKASDYQVIIFCQSFVQAAWATTVSGDGLEEKWLDRLFAHLYREAEGSVAFVFIKLDPPTAAKRVAKRAEPGMRFDALPFEQIERLFAAHGETFRMLMAYACRNTGASICYLDGSRPIPENAVRMADFIEGDLRKLESGGERREGHPSSSPRVAPDQTEELSA